MAQILDKQGLQHYANKMCNADNRKVGSKNLPTALNEIDIAIDGFKTLFETEYGTPVNMELENNENVFSIGTGTNIDKKDDVENSFTDVELNGNSLVNLFTTTQNFASFGKNIVRNGFVITLSNTSGWAKTGNRLNLKPNTTYYAQVTCENKSNNTCGSYIRFSHDLNHSTGINMPLFPANSITTQNCVFTTDDTGLVLLSVERGEGTNKSIFYDIILLEGDWTNKSIPQYFEGLKSVGEKENGNHKISILSLPSNPNLIQTHCTVPSEANWSGNVTDSPTELIEDISCPNGKYIKMLSNSNDKTELGRYVFPTEKLEIGKKYSWSFWCKSNKNLAARCGAEQGGTKMINITPTWQKFTHTFTATNSIYWAFIFYLRNAQVGDYICVHSIKLEEGESITDWCPNDEEIYKNLVPNYSKSDKKEISLNEPLRGLPNGVKDTIEKINGEWKIVRRCGKVIFNGSENWTLSDHNGETTSRYRLDYPKITDIAKKVNSIGICDTIPVYSNGYWREDFEMIENDAIYISIRKKIYNNLNEFKEWLSQNPTKVIYELATPIIEDVSPITLQCWKNGTISIDEVLPVESTHTVALNKSAQIQKNIEELSILRNRIEALEKQYNNSTLNQAYELELLRFDMELDNIV